MRLVHTACDTPVKRPRTWCPKQFLVLAEMEHLKKSCLKICGTCLKTYTRQDKYDAHIRGHKVKDMRMI